MKKETLIVYGMKRSGNHGIINWIRSQKKYNFCNNIIPIAPILKGAVQIQKPLKFKPWLEQRYLDKVKGDQFLIKTHDPSRRFSLDSTQIENCIVSIEDHEPSMLPFQEELFIFKNILVIRDPLNMFASRLRRANKINHPAYPRQPGKLLDRSILLWKSYAKEFLEITSFLPKKTCVYFNSWFSCLEYRKKISLQLGLTFNDTGFNQVSKEGGGSSFDGTSCSGNSQLMDVLNRSSYISEQESHILTKIMKDPEIIELGEALEQQNF